MKDCEKLPEEEPSEQARLIGWGQQAKVLADRIRERRGGSMIDVDDIQAANRAELDKIDGYRTEMTASALLELLQLFAAARIPVWLDGGWGVDALLGEQTRPHKDVDIILHLADVPRLQEILGRRGFAIKEGTPPDSFVLADGLGLEVDVHAVVFDDAGNGVYRMQNGEDWVFPAEGFGGMGVIAGRSVPCLSPATQVLCHAHGYAPTEKDLQDMARLQERFAVELPPRLR